MTVQSGSNHSIGLTIGGGHQGLPVQRQLRVEFPSTSRVQETDGRTFPKTISIGKDFLKTLAEACHRTVRTAMSPGHSSGDVLSDLGCQRERILRS
jgi:hypothetical protein